MVLNKNIRKISPDKNREIKLSSKARERISPITLRILAINVLALVSLVIGLLYAGKYRQGLIESEILSLKVQAELFATALGESAVSSDHSHPTLAFSEVQQIVRRMVITTETDAKLFYPDGRLLIDSQSLRKEFYPPKPFL